MNGGAERDRTADPLLAKQVLSQLSYSPNPFSPKAANLDQRTQPQTTKQEQSSTSPMGRPVRSAAAKPRQRQDKTMVGPGRLELPTPRLSSVCSNRLSYGPIRVGTTRKNQRGPCLCEKEKRRRRYSPYCGVPEGTSQQRMCFDGRLTGAIYVLKRADRMSGNP